MVQLSAVSSHAVSQTDVGRWPLEGGGREGNGRGGAHARLGRGAGGLLLVALAEPLDAAGGVDQLLLAREERVALAADLDAAAPSSWSGSSRSRRRRSGPGPREARGGCSVSWDGAFYGLRGPGASPRLPGAAFGAVWGGPGGRQVRISNPKADRVLPLRHRSRHGRAEVLAGPARDDDRPLVHERPADLRQDALPPARPHRARRRRRPHGRGPRLAQRHVPERRAADDASSP